jgi:hypothetical protein
MQCNLTSHDHCGNKIRKGTAKIISLTTPPKRVFP